MKLRALGSFGVVMRWSETWPKAGRASELWPTVVVAAVHRGEMTSYDEVQVTLLKCLKS